MYLFDELVWPTDDWVLALALAYEMQVLSDVLCDEVKLCGACQPAQACICSSTASSSFRAFYASRTYSLTGHPPRSSATYRPFADSCNDSYAPPLASKLRWCTNRVVVRAAPQPSTMQHLQSASHHHRLTDASPEDDGALSDALLLHGDEGTSVLAYTPCWGTQTSCTLL